jgi:hypothetical protein
MADERTWKIHVPEDVGKVADTAVKILNQLLSVFRHTLLFAVGMAAFTIALLCRIPFPPQATPMGLPKETFGIAVVVAVTALWLSVCVWWVLIEKWKWRARWHLHNYLTQESANLLLTCLFEGWLRVDSGVGSRHALEADHILVRIAEGETHDGKRLSLDYVLQPWVRVYLHNRKRLKAIFPGITPELIGWVLRDRLPVNPPPQPPPQPPSQA